MPRTDRIGFVAALVVALTLVAGCGFLSPGHESGPQGGPTAARSTSRATESAPAGLERFYAQRPSWKRCGGGFRCTRIVVPLDYAKPTGRTITIAVNRRPARHKSDRIGSLLVNPGGPGASGLTYARRAGVVSDDVLDHFDLVGFDPRGVGSSTPVRCLDDKETDEYSAADGSPDNAAEESRLVSLSRLFGQRCRDRSGALAAHVGTRDAARDLDVLRAVVGDERLFYLGKSYGTYLGEMYADLFPGRVGRLVLDGVVDPMLSSVESNRGQAVGFELALRSFAQDCVRRSECPYHGSTDDALAGIQRLLDRVDSRPLRGDGRDLTQALATLGVAFGLYNQSYWAPLREALRRAERGDGSLLLTMSDLYSDRDKNGHYTTNETDALYAVNCSDRPEEKDLAKVRATAARLAAEAPHFGAYLAWSSLPCAYWPYPPSEAPRPVHAPGSRPILVVGTTRDPATPYSAAQALSKQLDSARLLTYDGDGHTAYRHGSSCIDRAVDRYLIKGSLPAAGRRCR